MRERRGQRQKIGDAGDDDRDGMDVHAGDMDAGLGRAALGATSRLLGLGEEIADRVEQEGARAAAGVEHALLERAIDGASHHLRRQPVRRVVFAETVPLRAVDQRFVEDFEYVAFNLGEAEAADVVHDPPDQRLAFRVGRDPVEKVAFDCAADAGRGEGLARQ